MATRTISDASILAQIAAARSRERKARNDGLRAMTARYQRASARIRLGLSTGVEISFPAASVIALRGLTPAQLGSVTLDSSGGTLRWDALDIDLSVAGLILAMVGRTEQARQLARIAGSVSSPAKAIAARRNGAKGGRPRKAASTRS